MDAGTFSSFALYNDTYLAHILQQNVMPCLKIACDLGIFHTLAADKHTSKTALELAEKSHADQFLTSASTPLQLHSHTDP